MDIPKAIIALRRVIKFSVEEDYYVVNARETLLNVKKVVQENYNTDLDSFIKLTKIFDESFEMLLDKEYEKAMEGFKNVLLIDENHYQSYGNLGLCYVYLDNKEEAIKCFKKSLEIEPDYFVAKNNLDNVLLLKNGESFSDLDIKSMILK
jgi:tetratricopeptide (TPR) repeat protein